MQNLAVKILKVGLAAVFFVPLIYSSATIFPFIFPKTIAFRIIIETLLIPYIFLILTDASYRPRRSKILLFIIIFFFAESLATILGVDPLRSFWGNHERMMGLFTYSHIILFFVMAISVYRTKAEWKKFLFYAVIAGIIVAALGYVQYFSDSFLHEYKGGRIYSTFGNSIYLAAYLLFQVYLLLWFALGEKKILYRLGLFGLIFLELAAFFWAHTRGATIALIVSAVCFVMLFVYQRLKTRKGLVAAVAITPVILFLIFYLLGRSEIFGHIKIFSVFNEMSSRITTAQTRFLNWQIGLRAWSSRPILGWGPENYYIGFNKFYDPKFFYYSNYETWQDHAHNFIVDKLSDSGVLGLMAFLALFVTAMRQFWKLSKRPEERFSGNIFLALLIAYFVQNFFVFDTLGIWIMLYAIFGYAHICAVEEKGKNEAAADTQPLFMRLDPAARLTGILGVYILVITAIVFANIIPFTVSAQTIKAGGVFSYNPKESYELIKNALERPSPYKAESRDELSKVVTAILQNSQNLTRDDAMRMMLKVNEEYKKNVEAHPRDVYFNMNAAQWNMFLANIFDPRYYLDAEQYLSAAKDLSPKRQQIYYLFMRLYILRGRYAEAATFGKEVVDLEKNVPRSHWQYGEALARAGEKDAGYREMKSALSYDWGSPFNSWIAPEMDFYMSLARENKDEAEYSWWTGVARFNQNNYKEAYEFMSRADKLGYTPNFFEYLVQYLNSADAIGKPHTDLGMIKRYEEKYSKSQETEFQTARVVLNSGNVSKAKELLEEVIAKYPGTNTATNASVLLGGLPK